MLQENEGVPYRAPADLDPLAEFFFAQALPRAQLTVQDRIAKSFRNVFAQALAVPSFSS